jgi:hypothetical protein
MIRQLCGQSYRYVGRGSRLKVMEYRNKYKENLDHERDIKTDNVLGIDHIEEAMLVVQTEVAGTGFQIPWDQNRPLGLHHGVNGDMS